MIGSLTFRSDLFVIGLIAGLGYAVLAAGLMLVYRAKRVLNLAHGQIGALCAGVLVVLHDHSGWPYGFALLAAVALGGAIGLVVDVGIARRLTKRSTLAVLVATIGVSQLLLVAQFKLPEVDGLVFPTPFDATVTVGNVILHSEHLMLLAFGPLTLLALAVFLRRSRTGLHIRAVADNDDAARLAGVSSARVETLVWTLAGVLAAVAAILTVPLAGLGGAVGTGVLGPALLLRALAAALAGRLERVRPMLIAAIGIGVVEAILQASYPQEPGLTDAVLFVFVMVLLVVRGRSGAEAAGDGDAGAVAVDPVPLPATVRDHPRVKLARRALTLAVFAAVVALPLAFGTSAQLFRLSRVPIFALIGLSVVVLTGWTGQLSLGQSAFVGIGALGTAALQLRGVPFGAALAYSTVAGIAVAVAVGAPALRIRGLYLAVSTLAFGVATSTYLLGLGFLGSGGGRPITVRPGELGPFDLNRYRTMYFLCAGLCAVVAFALARARRTAVGRAMGTVECNDRAASALTASPAVARLTAFALSGGLAALAGGLLGAVTRSFSSDVFNPDLSFQVLAMAVIGGVGSVGGAVIGACYLVGLPVLFGDSNVSALATSGIGLLVLLLIDPRGLVGLLNRVRDPIAYRLAGFDGRGPAGAGADATEGAGAAADGLGGPAEALAGLPGRRLPVVAAVSDGGGAAVPRLEAQGLEVRLGGRAILDGVDLVVGPGEIVGLIGTNGAGKTTVLNAVGGMVRAVGTVRLDGTDVSGWRPHERAAFGLGRSFQDARLFPRLTVRECVELAGERHHRVELVPTLLALAPSVRAERTARLDADELLGVLGLDRFADALAGSLSTGTRRLVELAQLVALRPKIVLLDEPTAGLAAVESEAFAALIRAVRDELGTPVLVIEHDVRLMLGLCDRLYCLEAGSVIAEGPPAAIRDDPGVIASYLGRSAPATAGSTAGAATSAGGPE